MNAVTQNFTEVEIEVIKALKENWGEWCLPEIVELVENGDYEFYKETTAEDWAYQFLAEITPPENRFMIDYMNLEQWLFDEQCNGGCEVIESGNDLVLVWN